MCFFLLVNEPHRLGVDRYLSYTYGKKLDKNASRRILNNSLELIRQQMDDINYEMVDMLFEQVIRRLNLLIQTTNQIKDVFVISQNENLQESSIK